MVAVLLLLIVETGRRARHVLRGCRHEGLQVKNIYGSLL